MKANKAGYEQREKDPLDKEDRCEKCYTQGIKEVVEWIEQDCGYDGSHWRHICEATWQAKLKEWGL